MFFRVCPTLSYGAGAALGQCTGGRRLSDDDRDVLQKRVAMQACACAETAEDPAVAYADALKKCDASRRLTEAGGHELRLGFGHREVVLQRIAIQEVKNTLNSVLHKKFHRVPEIFLRPSKTTRYRCLV